MNRYAEMTEAVLAVFGTPQWAGENIPSFPFNWVPKDAGSTFIRIDVVPGNGSSLSSLRGQVLIDIFTPAGESTRPAIAIADKLDKYLIGKSFPTTSGVVQCLHSAFSNSGLDRDNPSLWRSTYVIDVAFHGVT
jgi:hypothetical protein